MVLLLSRNRSLERSMNQDCMVLGIRKTNDLDCMELL